MTGVARDSETRWRCSQSTMYARFCGGPDRRSRRCGGTGDRPRCDRGEGALPHFGSSHGFSADLACARAHTRI